VVLGSVDPMTLDLAPVTGTHWMSPEQGLWVASRHGEFLGMIERADGRYRASDSQGRARGTFEGLAEAQFAVDREKGATDDRRELVLLRATIVLAGLTTLGLAFGIFQLAS
jgi:hypothetical protein